MLRLFTAGFVLLVCTLPTLAQTGGTGPDVIVGDVFEIQYWGQSTGISAYSIGTESCNIGTQNLIWDANTNQHPAIAGNMYRLRNGRFEQIGMSWVKHGFYALSNTLCGSCPVPTNGTSLGVGCSDPYSASLNGTQSLLGPRNEVNASSGYFPYPPSGTYPFPDPAIGERLQVLTSDINPLPTSGDLYFVQGHYVHPTDAAAGNKNNNASYRQIDWSNGNTPPNYSVTTPRVISTTQRTKPAIQAWQDNDSTVQIKTIDIAGDGRVFVAFKATQVSGNVFHYEFAVQNLNSDRAIGSFSIEIWPGANVTNIGFHQVPYHSGEPYSNAAWTPVLTPGQLFPGSLKWACQTYAQNTNASALRWGSMYNFRFDSDQLPGNVTLGLFKPGTPTTMAVPAFCAPKRPPPAPIPPYTLNTAAAYDYVNISNGSYGPYGDDVQSTVTLPWSFPFYGQTYNQLIISTNGYLTVPGQNGTLSSNTTLPSSSPPNGVIATYWADLICPNFGDVRYATVNNRFVVYWNGTHLGDTQPVQIEAILEQNGSIVSTIVTMPTTAQYSGLHATRGIEAATGTQGLLYSYNTPNSALSGTSIRFDSGGAVPVSSNLFVSGSLGGGWFRMVYVGIPNAPILTIASYGPGPLNLGQYGSLPIDINTAFGLMDYYGTLTGTPNPAAVTDSGCGQNSVQFWVNQSSLPSGVTFWLLGLGFDALAPNSVADISNGLQVTTP